MKKLLLLVALVAGILGHIPTASAQTTAPMPQIQWVDGLASARDTAHRHSFGGTPHTLTMDAAGNVYTSIAYSDSVLVGGQHYAIPVDSSQGIGRWALVKYSPTGQILWTKPNIGTGPAGGIRVDNAGNVFTYGGLHYVHDIDGTAVDPALGTFPLCKFSPTGQLLWMQQMGIPGAVNFPLASAGLSLTPAGNVLFVGWYFDSAQVGPIALGQPIQTRYHGARVSTGFGMLDGQTGNVRWAQSVINLDSATASGVRGIGADAQGAVYLVGGYAGQIQIGSHVSPVAAAGQSRIFWAKFAPNGQCIQLRTMPSPTPFYVTNNLARASVTPDGYTYLQGWFDQPFNLGGVALTPANAVRDSYVARLDPNGIVQQAVSLGAMHGNAIVDAYSGGLALDEQDKLYFSGAIQQVGDTSSTQALLVALDRWNLNKKYWTLTGGGAQADRGYSIRATPDGRLAWAVQCQSEYAEFNGTPVGLPTHTGPGYQRGMGVVMQLAPSHNLVQGEVFVDANANGQRDAGEGAYQGSGPVVEVAPGPAFATPNHGGQYAAQVGQGTFTTTLPNPPLYHTAVPVAGNASVTFSSLGNVGAGRTFALQPIANQQDVQVLLTLVSPARPGAPISYQVMYRNVGTVPVSGNVALTYDSRLQFVSSSEPASAAGTVLTWAYAPLQPGESRRLTARFRLATTAVPGTTLSSTATVTPLAGDLVPADNTSTALRVITSSFDPNTIEVNRSVLSTTQVQAGEMLEYTVRFQNHGTDTAFTVMIRDTLPADLLQLGTFDLLVASHDVAWGVNQTTGLVVINLTDIKLPPQITDPFGSDGFVRFQLRPRTVLVPGDRIPNKAEIHFDFNAPVTTNTAVTIVQAPTGLPTAAATGVAVWPNPTHGTLHVEAPASSEPLRLTLLDELGRAVLTQAVPATAGRTTATLDVRGLPAGLYLLRGQGGATFSQRVVVQ